jgi:hypothetical protein
MATTPGRQEATMTGTPVIGRFRQAIGSAAVPACAGHHRHLLTGADGQTAAGPVFCGGRWPAALLADMEAAGA